jgi:uncharacterized protein (TIGR00251 family)
MIESSFEGVVIDVWAVPRAARTEIVGVHDDALRIRVAAPPSGGAVNDAIGALLTDVFGVRSVLVAGAASRRKRFLISGVTVAEAAAALTRVLG